MTFKQSTKIKTIRMKNYVFVFVGCFLLFASCAQDDELVIDDPVVDDPQGYNMLLIGNSFFRPYAEKLDDLAIDAGFVDHTSELIFRGGENGRPINFWNDNQT